MQVRQACGLLLPRGNRPLHFTLCKMYTDRPVTQGKSTLFSPLRSLRTWVLIHVLRRRSCAMCFPAPHQAEAQGLTGTSYPHVGCAAPGFACGPGMNRRGRLPRTICLAAPGSVNARTPFRPARMSSFQTRPGELMFALAEGGFGRIIRKPASSTHTAGCRMMNCPATAGRTNP